MVSDWVLDAVLRYLLRRSVMNLVVAVVLSIDRRLLNDCLIIIGWN